MNLKNYTTALVEQFHASSDAEIIRRYRECFPVEDTRAGLAPFLEEGKFCYQPDRMGEKYIAVYEKCIAKVAVERNLI